MAASMINAFHGKSFQFLRFFSASVCLRNTPRAVSELQTFRSIDNVQWCFSDASIPRISSCRSIHFSVSKRSLSSSDGNDNQSSDSSDDDVGKVELTARPKDRKLERRKFNEVNKPQQKEELPFAQKVLQAAEAVGQLSNDPDKTVGDLLSRLQGRPSIDPDQSHDHGPSDQHVSLGDLLSNMKMEDVNKKTTKPIDQSNVMDLDEFPDSESKDKSDLFSGARLNIFDPEIMKQPKRDSLTPLMDKLGEQEMEMFANFPPANAFQEMVKWTKEGKMWQFPIDNEQGLEDEMNVPFTEHVFLDHLIEDFPKKGPIRHFMELVVVGLSKNPYLTVQEKHNQIDWFREYFKDKYHLVEFAEEKQEQIQ